MTESAPGPLDVDVVIVAFNAGRLLEDAIESVVVQVPSDRAVIVDVGSTDESTVVLTSDHPLVRVITAPNRGFSAGNNVGIAATNGEFVLLNPDAVLGHNTARVLEGCARTNPNAAIVAPRILDSSGGIQMGSYGRFPTLFRALELHPGRLTRRALGRPIGPRNPATVTQVDWVTGACMMVRRAAITDAGPMDGGFFLYYEDVEWCHCMHDRGWQVLVDPSAICVHHVGGSGGASPAAARAYRESFHRYCRMYGLWGPAALGHVGVAVRRVFGGRS